MSLTPQDIKKIAELSRIKIEELEVPQIAEQLNGIMDWIDQLNTVDLSGLADEENATTSLMHERKDEVTEPNRVKEILFNAPMAKHEMFVVPKMVE